MFVKRAPRLAAVILMAALALLSTMTTLGAVSNDFSAVISCEGFTPSGGLTANRDNTGRGQESIAFTAVDGVGNIVFQLIDAVPLNWSVTPAGVTYAWTTPPVANPISMSVVSLGGNGLAQETLYSVSGDCDGLAQGTAVDPASVAGQVVVITSPTNFTVSPSILPGQPVPVPRTNADFIESLPYYAIVNTPNLNMRSGDGPEYTTVAVLRGGTRAQVLGRNETFSWWLLDAGGFRGWVSAEFIALRGDLTDVPELIASGQLQPATFVTSIPQTVFRVPSDLNRDVVCQIPAGEYILVGRNNAATYYQIQTQCTDGRLLLAWLSVENGAFRNPAGLTISVIETD
jgi:hypothetical protein